MTLTIWKERARELEKNHLTRTPRTIESSGQPLVRTPSGCKLNFCSNDYLGLANDPRIKSAMIAGVERWGAGTGSSRLVSGNTSAHDEAERAFAEYMGEEAAVLFSTGYQANVGALAALTETGDSVFSDALVHASIVDGCRLSKANVSIYRHLDMNHLDELLAKDKTSKLKLVVTDAVFSMDGDIAPLKEIVEIAGRRNAMVYVDEAHALGVMGSQGSGLADDLQVSNNVAVRIGTLGKAFGTFGAFVATNKDAALLIRSKARSLLYTTALATPIVCATTAALEIVKKADAKRNRLNENISRFRALASAAKIPCLESNTAIQPVLVGPANLAVKASEKLWQRGIFVQGIRPPTVPEDTSRLRISLTASHESEHIERLIEALHEVFKEINSLL